MRKLAGFGRMVGHLARCGLLVLGITTACGSGGPRQAVPDSMMQALFALFLTVALLIVAFVIAAPRRDPQGRGRAGARSEAARAAGGVVYCFCTSLAFLSSERVMGLSSD
jgi:hypothetical protein